MFATFCGYVLFFLCLWGFVQFVKEKVQKVQRWRNGDFSEDDDR